MQTITRTLLTVAVGLVLLTFGCLSGASSNLAAGVDRTIAFPSLLGKSRSELVHLIGEPHAIEECGVPLDEDTDVVGVNLAWEFIKVSEGRTEGERQKVSVCLVDGVAVAESRKWEVIQDGVISTGETMSVDAKAAEAATEDENNVETNKSEEDTPDLPI